MRTFALVYISLLLIVVDRVTTWVAINSNFGEETNPHVKTESLATLFLSPVPLMLCGFFIVCLLLSEAYSNQIYSLLVKGNPLAPICLLPLFFIWMMSIVCFSNLSGALGFITPLSWFASKFDFITDDRHELITIALTVLNIAGLPLLTRIGLRIYAPTQHIATKH